MAKHMLHGSLLVALLAGAASHTALADETVGLRDEVARQVQALEGGLIERRRDIHAHPELGNQETRTARLVADHLRRLGMEVRTGVARTGVVGVLRGGRPGPVVALRADIDLSALRGRVVVYAYPRTGRPGVENPEGWDMIPARGAARPSPAPSATTSPS